MNKIINKALFYKEWIYVKWITLLTIATLLSTQLYGVISSLNISGSDYWFNYGIYEANAHLLIMVFVVLTLATTLFLGEKTSETEGFIASMPFTRKEIIWSKWIVGVISLLISFAVTYVVLSLVYFLTVKGLDTTLNPYSDIIKWFFMDMFQYICIFTFIMLIQTVMGNSIVSTIVGGIILMVPLFISTVAQIWFDRYYGFTEYISVVFDHLNRWLNIYFYNLPQRNKVYEGIYEGSSTYSSTFSYYSNYKSKLLVLILLTCLFLYLAYVAYSKRNIEYNLRLIVFKNLEPVFIVGVAICLGLLAATFMDSDRFREFGIWFVIFTIIGYFISKLLLKVLSSSK
jgi:ABC-type transport system involved in multi-copper enzyme maturation permease subunit